MLRLFVALSVPDQVKSAIGDLRAELGQGLPSLRWVRPEGIHLTLRFLGDVPEEELDTLRRALTPCAAGLAPFTLETVGVGVFPHLRAPRVFWVGFRTIPDALFRLQERVERAINDIGFTPERRAFRPHLTVGRFRRQLRRADRDLLEGALRQNEDRGFGEVEAARLSLYRSTLLPAGARYDELGSWPLGPAAGKET
jgi:2'-5' RNA ligase